MKWRGLGRSGNYEDRRGRPSLGRTAARGGGGLGLIAVVLVIVSIAFPETASFLRPIIGAVSGGPGPVATQTAPTGQPSRDDETLAFVTTVLKLTEEEWAEIFASGDLGRTGRYQPPVLVLFEGRTTSPCGAASSAAGPFYCPADEKIYIDPAFYEVMARQLKAPGDFAQAYVIAHEVAHHVQKLTGQLIAVNRRRAAVGQIEGNRLTVRLELQADCFSGVWARRIQERRAILEQGDLEEALRAAYQVGDDILMRMSGRRVDERQFTHGSAEQRRRWFAKGWNSGEVASCETFRRRFEDL
ncbi:MAG: neutral zinc metallopeptidase [Pseudomonadota bacterium]